MNTTDDLIREAFVAACSHLGIDVGALTIEIRGEVLNVSGRVATFEQRHELWSLLETVDARVRDIVCRVVIAPLVHVGTTPAPVPEPPERLPGVVVGRS
ncbi:MAG: hypothetical protein BGN99_16200 [Alphaproteobacteria bacterium 65-37]|jgi:hypothetical protein|nr:hypothetical protein [Alphaproteobacteria bacterium]OJU34623.1 MAG: hypothetical protein BGN99_16200 [Alphaproteobacteria bacterium 65-37]